MSVESCLPDVDKRFLQSCPLCGRNNRMVARGTFIGEEMKTDLHPDMGYSFCNCRSIFYTDKKNIREGNGDVIENLKAKFSESESGKTFTVIMPDPFFIDWPNPEGWLHFNPRANEIIWDMFEFCEEVRKIGFEIVKAERNFKVNTPYPQTMLIEVKKP